MLAAQGVTQRFGDVVALEGLDLEVSRGEFVVVVGASGCGKSTLLNLFAGFDQPTEGRVTLMGETIGGVEPRCGMVFQNYALFPWLSVRGNITFGPGLRGDVSEARVTELIRTVGIEGFGDHYPAQLSGGMKQRVALARTLANDPEVLLCDEPFAALDAMTRQVLQEELSRLAAATGKTVVFITHSIDEALLLSDRIVVMTARPGQIKTSLVNPLPRPRSAGQQLTPEYLELKRSIWKSVQEEVLVSISATS
ncbi:MAG: ABC transporter ATP-binding protein [bacterium]|nr:ABC transporter ATP-binding protein [bacterium]